MTEEVRQAYENVLRLIDKRNKAEGDTISAAHLRRQIRKLMEQQ